MHTFSSSLLNFPDCDDKIKHAESSRCIHQGWLREAEELLTGEGGERVDIVEHVSEEEYQRDQGEEKMG